MTVLLNAVDDGQKSVQGQQVRREDPTHGERVLKWTFISLRFPQRCNWWCDVFLRHPLPMAPGVGPRGVSFMPDLVPLGGENLINAQEGTPYLAKSMQQIFTDHLFTRGGPWEFGQRQPCQERFWTVNEIQGVLSQVG